MHITKVHKNAVSTFFLQQTLCYCEAGSGRQTPMTKVV